MLNTNTYVTSVPLRVSKVLQEGEKFMKWDDVSRILMVILLYTLFTLNLYNIIL